MNAPRTSRRNEPCPCGSGKRFKRCCGEFERGLKPETSFVSPNLTAADRVLVVPGFLDRGECARLTNLAGKLKAEEGAVTRERDGQLVTEQSAYRVTTVIKTFDVPEIFVPIVARALREHVEPEFDKKIEWFEWPDVLFYRPGGRYDVHTDADLRDKESRRWRRVMDRDFSLLIYLNDEFIGGQLEFPERGQTIRPQAGMLVAFPSDHRFAHAALPVESGSRYVIVSWAAAIGSPRVLTRRRLLAIYPDREILPDDLPLQRIEGAGYCIRPRRGPPA